MAFKVIQGRYQSKARVQFLLVINSNRHPISYCFRVIAAYCSNFGYLGGGLTYKVQCSSWAHWKDFLLVLIEVFSLGVTAESLCAKRLKIGDFAPMQSL